MRSIYLPRHLSEKHGFAKTPGDDDAGDVEREGQGVEKGAVHMRLATKLMESTLRRVFARNSKLTFLCLGSSFWFLPS